MEIIGHHTCSKEGGEEKVLRDAPFKSRSIKGKNYIPFLGAGYYFWEDNIEAAKYWGQSHYADTFFILEFDVAFENDKYLDLVGSRKHLMYFQKLQQWLIQKKHCSASASLGEIVEKLKILSTQQKGIFPFKIIRAIDATSRVKDSEKVYFQRNQPNFLNMNPKFVVCIWNLEEVNLYSRKIIIKS